MRWWIIVVILIASFSCKTKKQVIRTVVAPQSVCVPIIKIEQEDEWAAGDFYNIDTMYWRSNCIEVVANTSGGCGMRNYTLLWNGVSMKSYPPRVSLMLKLDKQDACRAIVYDTLRFDPRVLLETNQKGEVWVRLNGFEIPLLINIER
jgi:hypothetical protein